MINPADGLMTIMLLAALALGTLIGLLIMGIIAAATMWGNK